MKLLTYAPDLDPIDDGSIIDCNHIIPTIRGIAAAPQAVLAEVTATAVSAVIGAATLIQIDGDARTFYGSNTKLYELVSSAWTDRSGGAGTYTTVTDKWRFAQYGNVSLAVSKENVLQESSSAAFTAVISTATGSTVTAPAAAIVETVNEFVFMADTSNVVGFAADAGDRWICSAQGDYADWTPDTATQCVTGRLTSIPGKIIALKKFGDQIVAYKERGLYVGSYIGAPIVWQFPELPTALQGTWCQESVIALGTPEQPMHFFVGRDDFYIFDGARVVPVGYGVKEAFFANLNTAEADKIHLLLNREKSLVYVFYPSGGSTTADSCLVFNYRTRKWGVDNRTIAWAFEYIGGAVSYSALGGYLSNLLGATATYGGLAALNLTYGDMVTQANRFSPAFFTTGNVLYTLTGSGADATITTHDYGSDEAMSALTRVTPRWIAIPDSATMDNYYWMFSGDTLTLDTTTAMDTGRFDVIRSAAWHRFKFDLTGSWELKEVKIDAVVDGYE